MKTNFFPLVLGCVLLLSLGYSPSLLADGPYHGRVIDKETKQPIEGAAVVAIWWKETAMIGHPIQSVHDAQETLTDKDGNFTIPGTSTISLNPFSRIWEPKFTIFKPGYQAYGAHGGWSWKPISVPETIALYEKDDRTVAELKPLKTRDERIENQRQVSISSRVPEEKYPELIRLRNIERENLGLKPTYPPKKGDNK
jgi:hypothetical protein